jgi:transcriptional regulator with XRE-family HTH domain
MTLAVATATKFHGIPRLMDGAKKLERDARLRAMLKELRDNRYKTTAALARALGVEGPTITEVLNGKRGVGLELMVSMADLLSMSLDELAGRAARPRSCLADLPRWREARADAERRLAHVRPEVATAALDRVGACSIPETSVALTGLFVARLAEAILADPAEY